VRAAAPLYEARDALHYRSEEELVMATKIHCPRCAWEPSPHDRWQCRPGCYTVWNTFETRACCPGCSKQWRITVCLACAKGSLHEHWYHDEAADADQSGERVEERDLVEVGADA
jgi:hypothetical protein